jgi:hypothetical protein
MIITITMIVTIILTTYENDNDYHYPLREDDNDYRLRC